ncbi:MAG TPA: efflux RND transporter periplasmic adaptor subunit, partial [Gemmatimonadaceae bacterium]|nr:efflux RND transporter periplasmic adaptor subunit [Gemmatimonadaceae bacterium]
MTKESVMMMSRVAAYSSLLIAAGVSAACKGSPPQKAPPPTPVRVATASRIDAPVEVQASGVVEPMQTVSVTTQVTGSLLEVRFHEGDYVTKNEILFRIDPRPMQAAVDQARANLQRDQAQAAAAKNDDLRYAKLAKMGYVSQSQADQMHATALAQASSVLADEAALRSAEVNLGFTTIRAPIDGRTGSLLVRQGNNVNPSSGPLVVINQISPVLVRFPVLQQDFGPMQAAVGMHPLPVRATSGDSTQTTELGTLD